MKMPQRAAKAADVVKLSLGRQDTSGSEGDRLQIWLALCTWVRFCLSRPGWLISWRRDIRRIGLYQFTDRSRVSRQFNLLLVDSVAKKAENACDNPTRQFVLNELRREVSVDTRCPDFALPADIYLWSHPQKGFKKIERLRDAKQSERKQYLQTLSDFGREYLADTTGH